MHEVHMHEVQMHVSCMRKTQEQHLTGHFLKYEDTPKQSILDHP